MKKNQIKDKPFLALKIFHDCFAHHKYLPLFLSYKYWHAQTLHKGIVTSDKNELNLEINFISTEKIAQFIATEW